MLHLTLISKSSIRQFFLPVLILVAAFLANSCVPAGHGGSSSSSSDEYYADKVLRTHDHNYLEEVRTVKFYAESDKIQDVLNPPLQSLDQQFAIVLEFDILRTQAMRCQVQIINCDADWGVSALLPMQYMDEYNQFYITDMLVSNSTRQQYWHYSIAMPRVKLPGNYLAVVTGPGGDTDYILTRRFMIYDTRVHIGAEVKFAAGATARFTHQQLDFNLNYANFPVVNPQQEIKVVVRQNYRWDNAKFNLRPTFVREDQRRLEYIFFSGESAFPGGNEFRAFDTRSIRSSGLNVARINPQADLFEVELVPDRSRATAVYSQEFDINGQFIIGNREYGEGDTNGDYNQTRFTLRTPEVEGNVYVFGGLTDWKLDNRFRLTYDQDLKAYVGSVLLKQAYYNYIYVRRPSATSTVIDETAFEGSHNITENIYDILVYYRHPGQRADQLVGYFQTNYFGRR